MSKKVISVLISAALLVAMLCVGAVSASADTTYTYYFLAPDEYFTTNDSVGYYYWSPNENGPWPGLEMTPAPEVGQNVFKCEVSPAVGTIIFNAFVNAGDPADPELAPHAHQTVNIAAEGYYDDECPYGDLQVENFDGLIYVLNENEKSVNDLSGAATTGGAWFSLDPSSEYYYKNYSEYYGSYGFADESTTDTDLDTNVPVGTSVHAGDTVTVNLTLKNVDHLAGLTSRVYYNPDVLEFVTAVSPYSDISAIFNAKNYTNGIGGQAVAVNINGDVYGDSRQFAGSEPVTYLTITFNVIADANEEDFEFNYIAAEVTGVNSETQPDYDPDAPIYTYYVKNLTEDPELVSEDVYSDFVYTVDCPHVSSDTDSSTDTDSEVTTDTNSDTDTTSDTDSEGPVSSVASVPASSTDTDTNSSSSSSNTSSDPKETKDNASSSKPASAAGTTNNSNTAATVQTAGTFAVVSLVVILMAAAGVVLYTRKKTEE